MTYSTVNGFVIKYMDCNYKEIYGKLVIIGKGFDLHHGMQTSYLNYMEYLLRNGGKDIVECFEEQEELNEIYLWNNLEYVLGLLNYEKAYCYLIPYGNK